MLNRNTNWYRWMLAKYGSDEAITELMRKNSNKSKRNTGGKFNAPNEQAALEARRKGGLARAEKIRAKKQEATSSQNPDQTE